MTETTPHEPTSPRRLPVLKAVFVVALIAGLVVGGRGLAAELPRFASWVSDLGPLGIAVYILGYAIATVAFVPGSVLTLAAGAIFGIRTGTLTVLVGATLGAALAFLVARYLARGAVQRRLESRFRFADVDRAVARNGFKVVLLLRLSPVFPFNLLNYALGLTRVRFLDYLAASIGMLPASFLYVYYGAALGRLAEVAADSTPARGTGYWLVLGLGLVATLAVTILVTRLARRALAEEVGGD